MCLVHSDAQFVIEHQNIRTSEHQNNFPPEHQVTRIPEQQNSRTSEHQNIRTPEQISPRSPAHQSTILPEHQSTRTPEQSFKRYAHATSPFTYLISRWPALGSAGHAQPTAHRARASVKAAHFNYWLSHIHGRAHGGPQFRVSHSQLRGRT